MRNIVDNCVKRFRRERRKRKRLFALILAAAVAVTTGVTWQLHSTGIAMTNETYCGLEEHQHSADCYEEVLVCGKEESEEHTHTEDCYGKQLVCGLEEHTHTVECLTDETADVETASDWEAALPELSGNQADDIVSIAVSQLGYTESTANFTLADDGKTRQGYTRYGAWYGNEYGDWDAMFASFCLNYAGVDEEAFPEASGAYAWSAELNKLDLYEDAADYTPVPGDLAFFDTDEDGKADRVGVVEKLDTDVDGTETVTELYIIEGDHAQDSDDADAVCEVIYRPDDETIIGYGTASAVCEINAGVAEEDEITVESEAEYEAAVLTCEGDDYIVTVSYGEDAELPQGTELVVSEYDADSEIWQSRYEEASALYGWEEEHTFRLFNISLIADGEEAEPAAEVSVAISFPEQEEEIEYTLTHYTEQDAEDISVVSDLEDGTQSISFGTDGFSDFSLASENTTDYTVEYYAYLDVVETSKDSGTLAVLDTSADANGGTASTPANSTTNPKLYINLEETSSGSGQYKIATTTELTKIYTDETCTVEEYPDVASVNKLRDNSGYTLSQVLVSTDNGSSWTTYTYTASMTFTNVQSSADGTSIIYIPDGALVRLVYETATASENIGANLYDYDITDDGTNTSKSGINSSSNYSGSGAKLAFGNNNTGTGLASEEWNGHYINRANSGTVDYSCSFGIAAGLNTDGTIKYSSGIIAPALFNESNTSVNGKTTYSGQTLTFSQVGDTYTLSSVSGPNEYSITNLEYFTKLTNYVYSNGTTGATFWNNTIIYTNNFWPMDGVTGDDGLLGNYDDYANKTDSWCPVSDDSKDHNSYFGMQYSVEFTLTKDYCGPLNYLFFGDDDMWVFLTEPDGDSKLVCDIGGVHSSVGEYVDLWDYIAQGDTGTYTLTFFYTERGASGSSCYMQFTLPSVTSSTTVQNTGNLKVEKEVDSDEAIGNETFEFTLNLKNSSGSALTNTYAYDIFNSDGSKASSGSIGNDGTFTLKDGQYILVEYLPVGTQCTVTETTNGYTTYYTVGSGSLTEGKKGYGSITNGGTLTMKFVNSTPDVEKKVQDSSGSWVDENTTSIGSNVQFKTTISDVSGVTNLVLHDKLDTGLANPYVSGVAVLDSAGDTKLVNASNYTVTYYVGKNATSGVTTTDGCSFEISFTDSFLATLNTGDGIVVYYYATLTDDANIGTANGNNNTTRISYGDNSYSGWDTTTTYTFQIDILKYSGDEKLSGAEFILYYEYIYTPAEQQSESVTETRYALVDTDTGYLTGWTTERTSATTLISDSSGQIFVKGLDTGVYYLEETEAPDGYTLLSDPVAITVGSTGTVSYTVDGAEFDASTTGDQVQVENEPGYELPLTGGTGTLPYTMAGLLLSGGAAFLLYKILRRRKEEIC